MLTFKKVTIVEDTLLIKEYPVQVASTSKGGVIRTKDEISHLTATQVLRIGKVVKVGTVVLTNGVTPTTSLTKGKYDNLLGVDVIYSAPNVNQSFDIDTDEYTAGELIVLHVANIDGILEQ